MRNFDDAWRYELVRLLELEQGPRDDAAVNRLAINTSRRLDEQRLARARLIAQELGLDLAVGRVKQALRTITAVVWLLGLVMGVSAGLAALGPPDRPLNVIWALLTLLLLPTASMFIWGVAMITGRSNGGWLGHGWEWLTTRFLGKGDQAMAWRAWLRTAHSQGSERWWVSAATHSLWLAILMGILLALVVSFSLRHYTFFWQTTWLPTEVFVSVAQTLSALPATLGFSVPDTETIATSGNRAIDQAEVRLAWANWLVGLVLIFGAMPRLVLLVLSAWSIRWCAQHSAEPADAYAQTLNARLLQARSVALIDAAPGAADQWSSQGALSADQTLSASAVVALETSIPQALVAQALAPTLPDIVDRESRELVLTTLTKLKPSRLLVVCDANQTPDRGLLNTLAAIGALAQHTRVYLKPPHVNQERFLQWQHKLALSLQVPPVLTAQQALDWLRGMDVESKAVSEGPR